MTQRELDARVASIQYTETTDLNLPAIEVAGDAFEAGVEWADGHPHWISVEDELPRINPNDSEWEYSDDVIVALKDGSIAVGRYERDNSIGEHYWVLYGVDKDLIVTHWMALPQPPEHIAGISNKTACPDCFVAQYPPCGKGIPCCKCHEEGCNSRQPCPKKGGEQ